MLKKEHRLTKNKYFNYIYKKGKTQASQHLVLYYAKTKFQPFKVGFSVSNKIGKSTVRSKIKRRLRESFKFFIDKVDNNFNYVIVAKVGIHEIDFQQIKSELHSLLKKADKISE